MTANIIAGIAAGLSLIAAAAAVWSAISGHQSAGHAKDAAVAAKRSADSSDVSARAAEKSADADGKVAQVELEREHREFAPVLDDMNFGWEKSSRTGNLIQFLTFRLRRPYRVYGDLVHDTGARSPLGNGIGGLLAAGTLHKIFISDEGTNQPELVALRFFPPAEEDLGEKWACPCDRDAAGDVEKPGHWELKLPIPQRRELNVRFLD